MRSTFMGLETARRGMFTQQTALYTVGNNISNASTPGYSRQRVNFTSTESYPSVGLNRPQLPGQLGTGVTSGPIQRVRDSFLDVQYRAENNKLGYWQSKTDSLSNMEEIMNEPSDSGLSKTMDMFWQSLQDLAVDSTNAGARSVVRQRGVAVAETFNYLSQSLNSSNGDIKNDISVTEKEINSKLDQINQINKQIGDVEPHGFLPNDLYDERDRLIDELSSIVNVKVDYVTSGGNSVAMAEGQAVVKLVDANGSETGTLVDQNGVNKMTINFDGTDSSVKTIGLGSSTIAFNKDTFPQGKLKGTIESYGYDDAGAVKGTYPDMLAKLDDLAYTFSVNFNSVHSSGKTYQQVVKNDDTMKASDFFSDGNKEIDPSDPSQRKGLAGRLSIDAAITANYDNIATATTMNAGDASNVRKLGEVINTNYEYSPGTTSNFKNYFQSAIGGMAVDSEAAQRLSSNSNLLKSAVEERRSSVSSVSLDEEMTNMIQYQQAYNASARMISLQDELLDKIINGMGTGGR